MSEFGLQALPHLDTIHEMFPSGAPVSKDAAPWAARKLQADKLGHYSGGLTRSDTVATIVATQRTQAAGLQTGIEACRLRREGSGARHLCGGVAFWQFNEPWPAVTWSVVDRRGRPKAAYQMLARSYQPLLIAARFEWQIWLPGDLFRAEVWMVNDGPAGFERCSIDALLDGQAIYHRGDACVDAGSARRIGVLGIRLDRHPALLELQCSHAGGTVAHNEYDLAVYLPPRQRLVPWLMRRAADLLLQIG